ncbi:hypothetical protein ACE01N_00590 [Saccharicrinis sp. FJH2]|uniref:hypothetical protein n=1 Tax=Saccharicrinis sp. FJH65 TaxID=3344659 RepID=UPI0035F30E14
MRIITKENENNCDLSIYLHRTTLNRNFEFTKTYNRQFYIWKKYSETEWKLNEQIPVLAYISSWKDKRGYIRNCGARELSKGEDATNKILNSSPDYFILSYIVREINN